MILINLQGGVTRAEVSGGGFLDGAPPVATLDGAIELNVIEATQKMLVVDIPAKVKDGDYSLVVSTGNANKQNASFPISLGDTMTVACTDWFCCIGAGKWDGVTPDNGIFLEPKPQ